VITAKNLKTEVVDKGFESAKNLSTGRYAEGCKRLGITN
jgi:D-xylose transport system substrate-binding protein